MIAVDWGTSNFRAFRLDNSGAILERRSFPGGILRVRDGRYAETLTEQVGAWIAGGEYRILLCGMVGSRQGWAEAEYVACPAGIADLARNVRAIPFPAAEVMLVPGVIGEDADGVPEVMRGEETQAMGLVNCREGEDLVCLPGTHSKWIRLSAGRIARFSTCMTGDVYSALQQHTIFAQSVTRDRPIDEAAFRRGVRRSMDSGGLLHHLFSVRTLTLTGNLGEDEAGSYLSGLLIGHEVNTMMAAGEQVHLVGAIPLCSLYEQVITERGGTCTLEDEDAAARGLAAIARSLKWI